MNESDHTQPLAADQAPNQAPDPATEHIPEDSHTSTMPTAHSERPPTYDTSTDADTARSRGRHPANIGHLVMGIAFVSLFAVWGLITLDVVEGSDIRWLMPVPWVLAGLAGLVASVLGSRREAW